MAFVGWLRLTSAIQQVGAHGTRRAEIMYMCSMGTRRGLTLAVERPARRDCRCFAVIIILHFELQRNALTVTNAPKRNQPVPTADTTLANGPRRQHGGRTTRLFCPASGILASIAVETRRVDGEARRNETDPRGGCRVIWREHCRHCPGVEHPVVPNPRLHPIAHLECHPPLPKILK